MNGKITIEEKDGTITYNTEGFSSTDQIGHLKFQMERIIKSMLDPQKPKTIKREKQD